MKSTFNLIFHLIKFSFIDFSQYEDISSYRMFIIASQLVKIVYNRQN